MTNNQKHYQLIILGSGPAGCTAAIYAARANLNFALITGIEQGGQLTKTSKIANWPGEPEEISGMVLMEKMLKQVRNFSQNVLSDSVSKVDLVQRPFQLQGDNGEYSCDALIIATGASAKFLEIPSEQQYMGRGVSTCAVCDGFFYKNKNVVIVGGGNTMAEDALYLAKIASTVTIVHRRDFMRVEPWSLEQLKKADNVKFELNNVVDEILGDERGVTGVNIKDVRSGLTKTLEATGVFVAIGHEPNSKIFSGQLEMDQGYLKTGHGFATQTSVPGVFAAGDIVHKNYQQAVVAAGSGCTAALDAKSFLSGLI